MLRNRRNWTMKFRYREYEVYLSDRLCGEGESLAKYSSLFDFAEPSSKRRALSPAKYKAAWAALQARHGRQCQLRYCEACDIDNPAAIDHVIPLSSNELNKIWRIKPLLPARKVAAQSFGSNDISNLVLACTACNAKKKHRFLERETMRRILEAKGF